MKKIEVSKKIKLTKKVSEDDIKAAVFERLKRSYNVCKIIDNKKETRAVGTSGHSSFFGRHAKFDLAIDVQKDDTYVRIMIHGKSRMSRALLFVYSLLFLFILLLGLLPGSIETSYESSGAIDVLVFLIFGIFIFYDINKKVAEPREHLKAILDSVDAEFG